MAQTATHFVDHVIPHAPVGQCVLWLTIPLRLLRAAQLKRLTLVLQVVQREIKGTCRWRVTNYCRKVMGTTIYLREHHDPNVYSGVMH